ncbi:MBL fold metallo-hydrolase RNA specificity domain-containing protein [Daejeonella lutea]|uniref:Metallo-beta-lactamase family protein n=1 Tax=Daejeonella lutea TaxID=572036 RepID=A0A1T5D8F5_9SPHI|nr:MBL fold metallo-hydrolase [Daejeonella lutea]SKB67887.1 metallo-beta-lactamase family protein [Daejeonella lutea]
MRISFHGAARNVTGSKHLLTLDNGIQILLDCGMFQGMGEQTDELNEHFGFDPAKVSYLVLSHAHIDHSGLIPRLVSQGFSGPIFCTPPTMELTKILLLDSAKIQEQDAEYSNKNRIRNGEQLVKPLYDEDDAIRAIGQFKIVEYNTDHPITDGVTINFTDAGHIIGSAAVHLSIQENGKTTRISFSGDVGRYDDLILKAPQRFPQADYILLESTYGDTLHKDAEAAEGLLKDIINQTCVIRKGKVVIPAFSVGRTQELLYLLNGLEEKGILPDVKYYVDSPLSAKATHVVKNHSDELNRDVHEIMKTDEDPFHFKNLTFIQDSLQSKALNTNPEPCVIISASGMAEAGRVKHHVRNNVGNEKNTILMVGYCEPASLAGKLLNGNKTVHIFGEEYDVRADIRSIRSMSAHGDYEDLLNFISCQEASQVKRVFLIHGEYDVQEAFREKVMNKGFENVEIPDRHQEFIL